MRCLPAERDSRREFFRAAGRYSLLVVITVVTGWLVRQRAAGPQRCVGRNLCGQCLAFANCGLPPALSARQERERTMGR